ncbi:Zn-ribbon domain-containing OB-fold protein [Nocardia grenadensis]|uniref:Zn-ribbon domain-containing OB-fold protein n=1 Tax=Nocardia grenadensis TaxID=931537 RepID=UPI003D7036BF
MNDPHSDMAGYHRGITEGELRAPRCSSCAEYHWPPRAACPHCLHDRFEWPRLPELGELFTFTVVGHTTSAEFRSEVPFPVGMIAFPDLGIRLIGRIDADPGQLRIGEPLRWHPIGPPAGVVWRLPTTTEVSS